MQLLQSYVWYYVVSCMILLSNCNLDDFLTLFLAISYE